MRIRTSPGQRSTAAVVSLRVTAPTAKAAEQLHALDALRAVAMLLGIVLHASISYMTCRMPNLLWPVHDQSHAAFDWLFWWIHSFRLPLFFVIAGFFSARLWEHRGSDGFLANRIRRILIPLAAACVIVLPATYLIWCGGWLLTGQCTLGQALRIKFAPAIQRDVYGLAHLWFLEHLLAMTVGYWVCRTHLGSTGRYWRQYIDWARRILTSPWRPLVVALPAAAILWIDPDVVAGFHNSFVPDPLRLLYYTVFFTAGTLLDGRQHRLRELTTGWSVLLALSLPAMVSMGFLLRQYLDGGMTLAWRLALGADIALVAGLSVFGWLGCFLRFCHRPLAAIRTLADASYWIYLVHLPLVGLVQTALNCTGLPLTLKFLAAVIIPLGVTLVTYRWFVAGAGWGRAISGRGAKEPTENESDDKTAAWLVLFAMLAVSAMAAGCWQMRAFWFDGNRHVVLPGVLYRSAQPSTSQLRDSIRRWSLRSVINLQGGDPANLRFAHQRRVCQAAQVQFLAVDLPEDGLPSRQQLLELIAALERAQAPVLVHGRFGIARSGLAAAVGRLLAGEPLQAAKREFSWRHGSVNTTPYDCRQIVDWYEAWLVECNTKHTPGAFRNWVRHGYGPEKILLGNLLAEAAAESRQDATAP